MIRTALISTLAATALVVAGCGGGSDSDGAEAKAATSTPSATASADPYAANLGDRALSVGATRDGQDIHTTLHEVRHPYPPGEYRTPEKGNDFMGLRIEQCVDNDAEGDSDSTYNGEWSAVTPTGEEYGGDGLSWDDWPSPKFPESVGTIAGRCLKGWIALQVPKGTEFSTIMWRPDGDPVAEWVLKP